MILLGLLLAASAPMAPRAAAPAHEPGHSYAHEYAYEWRTSKTTPGARLPFLTGYANAAIQAKVNAQIQKELDEMGCGRVPAGVRAVWKTTARVTYAAGDVFSIDVVIEHDCGGPYPTNAAPAPMTFDLKTGARVPFDGLFKSYARDKEAIARAVFAGHVTDAEVPASDRCPDRWDAATLATNLGPYYVVPGGIVVTPDFPHVLEACAFHEETPAAKLTPFAAPNGLLSRLH